MIQTVATWEYVGWREPLPVLGFAALSGHLFFSVWRALSEGECALGDGQYTSGGTIVTWEDNPFQFCFGVFGRLFFGLLFLFLTWLFGTEMWANWTW
jgi:hypothetical protein